MEITRAFLINTLNTVKNNIAVTDSDFNIVFTNKSWDEFSKKNGCPPSFNWLGVNYFSPCLSSALDGDEFSVKAVKQFDQLKKRLNFGVSIRIPLSQFNPRQVVSYGSNLAVIRTSNLLRYFTSRHNN